MRPSREALKRPKPAEFSAHDTWADQARKAIHEVHMNLGLATSFEERMAAVDAAYPFGRRAHYPYKVWCKERRNYLSKFGLGQPSLATSSKGN